MLGLAALSELPLSALPEAAAAPSEGCGYNGKWLGAWSGHWFGSCGEVVDLPTVPVGHGKVRRKQPGKRGRYEVDYFSDWVREPTPPDDNEFLIIDMMTR